MQRMPPSSFRPTPESFGGTVPGNMNMTRQTLSPPQNSRFAFLNRTDVKNIQDLINIAKNVEKTEKSKVPRGAQVGDIRSEVFVHGCTGRYSSSVWRLDTSRYPVRV